MASEFWRIWLPSFGSNLAPGMSDGSQASIKVDADSVRLNLLRVLCTNVLRFDELTYNEVANNRASGECFKQLFQRVNSSGQLSQTRRRIF